MVFAMRRLAVPLLVAILLAGTFAWWFNQPEKVVARRVAGLFEAAAVEADAGNLTRSTRGTAIEPFLAPNISFQGPDGPTEEIDGPQPRDYVVNSYTALARHCRLVSLEKPEFGAITINGDEAKVDVKVDAVIELPNEERPVDGIQHLAMTWRKIDGKWRLSAAQWHETGR
jgi:hypothetical protein